MDKIATKRTADDNLPVHSLRTLLEDLATVAKNRVRPKDAELPEFDKITQPTLQQQRAFDLLGVRLHM